MKNKDYYPTPNELAVEMLKLVDFTQVSTVLEPSAGKGNLVEALINKSNSIEIDCIEKDETLRATLKGKGFRVIGNDFLKFKTFKRYDLIFTNVPFSEGSRHLLKILEMQEDGGQIVCLINAETLKNPYSNERKVLSQKLTKYQADITFLKDQFLSTERETSVEVAMVYVNIPVKEKESYFFKEALRETEFFIENDMLNETFEVADADLFKSIVKQYEIEVQAGVNIIKEFYAMKKHILKNPAKEESYENITILNLIVGDDNSRCETKNKKINQYIREVRRKYWTALFNNPTFKDVMTSNIKYDYFEKIDKLVNYDFSLDNIYTIKIEMLEQISKSIEKCIIDLFDYLDEKSTNIHYYNGWKTNQSWKINKKVILPLNAFWSCGQSLYYNPNYKIGDKISDILKVMSYLDGVVDNDIDREVNKILELAKANGETKKIRFKYFTVTFFKKETCHVEFLNKNLLDKLNLFGSQKKGWLPPTYGKKSYKEMTQEEKEVIDSFQGEIEYEKTLKQKDYFLSMKVEDVLMIS